MKGRCFGKELAPYRIGKHKHTSKILKKKGFGVFYANSDDIPWKNPQKSIIIRTDGRNTRIMMDFCGSSQGKSSEFA